MTDPLVQKLNTLDWNRAPYIWSLRLTEAEFTELARRLRTPAPATGCDPETRARCTLAFIAEWYKRCYVNLPGDTDIDGYQSVTGAVHPETLMKQAGIDTGRFFYPDALPVFSVFVLGGFALRHETRTPDRALHAQLCRIFRNNAPASDTLRADGRSAATLLSIRRKDSLHDYLTCLFSSNPADRPFAHEDIRTPDSPAARWLRLIRNAAAETLPGKFAVEWRIRDAGNDCFRRGLRIRLRPDPRSLAPDAPKASAFLIAARLAAWKLIPQEADAEAIRHIDITPQFFRKNRPLAEPDFRFGLSFENSNGPEHVFITGHADPVLDCWKTIPQEPVDEIRLLARADDHPPLPVQTFRLPELHQLWLDQSGRHGRTAWSSSEYYKQNPTAVIAPDTGYTLPDSRVILLKNDPAPAVPYRFAPVLNTLTVICPNGQPVDFHATAPAAGRVVVAPGPCKGLFESENAWVSSLNRDIPFLFNRHQLTIFSGNPPDGNREVRSEPIERIEYMHNGHPVEWKEETPPPFGLLTLRLFTAERPQPLPFTCILLPEAEPGIPVRRNLQTRELAWRTIHAPEKLRTKTFSRMPENGTEPPSPAVQLDFSLPDDPDSEEDACSVTVSVFRPILANVLVQRETRTVLRWHETEPLQLPYIAKDDTEALFWREDGFERFCCAKTASVFAGHEAEHDWGRAQWHRNCILATPIKGLDIGIGQSADAAPPSDAEVWLWDYINPPRPADWTDTPKDREILFVSRRNPADCLSCIYPKQAVLSPFKEKKLPPLPDDICLKCFDMAQEHHLCFFAFLPLLKAVFKNPEQAEEVIRNQIITPLRARSEDGLLTIQDRHGLERLAEELSVPLKHSSFKEIS